MKKVGVITFHRAINYGAVLQTYALQKFLNSNGYDSEVIDYRNDYMENFYKSFAIKDKTPKQIIRNAVNLSAMKKKKAKFRGFIDQYIPVSEKVYTKENIKESNNVYDCFISGSDQVLNFNCSKFDKNYFLDFVQDAEKKHTYAASFGMKQLPDEYKEEYTKLLSTFPDLSIRETAGQKIVKELTGEDSTLTVDPVFLLDQEQWSKIAKKPDMSNYIVIYKLNASDLIYDFARELAKKTGKQIVALSFDTIDQIKTRDIKGITSASIEEFLGYFKYADYVVTNSFHGTAFSVIFHKDFYVEPKQKDFKPNDRVESLLKITHLENASIYSLEDCKLDVERDFDVADKALKKERENASLYLENVLK